MKQQPIQSSPHFELRRWFVLGVFALAAGVLVWRAFDLQVLGKDFYLSQADARHLRVVKLPAHRGVITDRAGEPLGISTPVDSIWVDPQKLLAEPSHLPALAKLLKQSPATLEKHIRKRANKEFVYLKRHLPPRQASKITKQNFPGVAVAREYRRYYPAAEVAAHVVGFTNIDDVGQEGLELAFESWLSGQSGSKRVIREGLGRIIEDVEQIRAPRNGKALRLSIDLRVQYLAYRTLKAAVRKHRAQSGSAVVMDALTGEVLAMVNQPSFNPNSRKNLNGNRYRNRAITDLFEPGSTIKPFVVVTALAEQLFTPHSEIDTSPGFMKVGHGQVKDVRNYGAIDLTTVITKSSNVGVSRVALALEPQQMWETYTKVGFGQVSASSFPGEAAGVLEHYLQWGSFEQAALAFGYGVSVTALQLAQAYTVLASDGIQRPVSLLALDEVPAGERVLPERAVQQVRKMMETVVSAQGTAPLAEVAGYRIAGKTGTVRKPIPGGYADDRYVALFAGIAPASQPRLVTVVVIDEPAGEDYYGGKVAAPVFSQIMAGALRLLNITPDDVTLLQEYVHHGGAT